MNAVISGYIDDFVLVYLDNVFVYSNNADEHRLICAKSLTDCMNISCKPS